MPDDAPSYRAEPDGEFANRLERELLQRLAAGPSTAPADPADGTLAILDVSDDDWPPSGTPFVDGAPEPETRPTNDESPVAGGRRGRGGHRARRGRRARVRVAPRHDRTCRPM